MKEDDNPVLTRRDGNIFVITLNRPHVRNAVNAATADALAQAFENF